MKKLICAAGALLLATTMSFGQMSESSIDFTIPYADDAQRASVEEMGGSTVANLSVGSYTLVSTKVGSTAKSLKGNGKAENDGMALDVDCSAITDEILTCRADLPPVDFALPIIVHSEGFVTKSALTIIPGNTGCPGDAINITRTYFIMDNVGDAMCEQSFTIESIDGPVIICPADIILDCFTDDTTTASTGMATATADCSAATITHSDVSTQVIDGSLAEYNYTITRTWTATDFCGRTATCDQIITVASTDACLKMNGIPSMGQWALLILALLIASMGVVYIRSSATMKA